MSSVARIHKFGACERDDNKPKQIETTPQEDRDCTDELGVTVPVVLNPEGEAYPKYHPMVGPYDSD